MLTLVRGFSSIWANHHPKYPYIAHLLYVINTPACILYHYYTVMHSPSFENQKYLLCEKAVCHEWIVYCSALIALTRGQSASKMSLHVPNNICYYKYP